MAPATSNTVVHDALPTAENGQTSPSDRSIAPKEKISNSRSITRYFRTDITLQHADIPVIACCIVSGLCDSSAYNAWSCFVSMQTGKDTHSLKRAPTSNKSQETPSFLLSELLASLSLILTVGSSLSSQLYSSS